MAYSRGGPEDNEATQVVPPHPPTEVAQPHPATQVAQPHPPTEASSQHLATQTAAPHQPAQASSAGLSTQASSAGLSTQAPSSRPDEIVRYGPGVPVTPPPEQANSTAEQVWRTGRPPMPPRRPPRLRQVASSALTVILLVAAGIILFLRFHHAPFNVTSVAITDQTKTTCGEDITGRIDTSGSAGTISYEWLMQPQVQAPQPLSQSVVAGQHAAYVTVAIAGQGHGTASQTVTLQVLGPDAGTATARVTLSC